MIRIKRLIMPFIAVAILLSACGIKDADKPETKENTTMINPMKKVDSSEDFLSIDLSLRLPSEADIWSDAQYYIISGDIAHIKFHDDQTGSDAVARAGDIGLDDIAGIYYTFDDSKEAHKEVTTESGDTIDIRIQSIVDGSDSAGVLASWTYGKTQYTLWENEGKPYIDMVASMAEMIALSSAADL